MPGKPQMKITAKTAGSPTGKKRKSQISMENFTSKPKAQRSFSIRSPQRIRGPSTNKKIPQQVANYTKKLSNSTKHSSNITGPDGTSSTTDTQTSEDAEWQTDSDEFESDVSIEHMRSSDMPPPDSEFDLRNIADYAISSTPFSLSNQQSLHFTEGLTIPDVSYTIEKDDENYTVKAVNSSLKSLSPEKDLQVPPVPEESNEEVSDSTFSGFKFSDDSQMKDQLVSQSSGKEEDGVDILSRPRNHDRLGRRSDDEIGNSLKDGNNLNSEDNLEDNMQIRNTETPKKKGKLYRGVGMRSNSRMGRLLRKKIKENSFAEMIKRGSEDSLEDVQKKEPPLEDLENHPKETITEKEETKYNNRDRVSNKKKQCVASNLNTSQSSSSLRTKHVIDEKKLLEDMNRGHDEDSNQAVLNIYNAVPVGDLPKTVTHQEKRKNNKRLTVGNKMKQGVFTNLNRSQNSSSSRMRRTIEEKNSNRDDDEDSIETVLNIHDDRSEVYSPDSTTHEGKRKYNESLGTRDKAEQDVVRNLNISQNSISLISKHMTRERNSSKDLNRDDDADYIETARNMQNEEINTFEDMNRVDDDVDNIQAAPSMQNEGRNSLEDMNRDGDVDNIQTAPSMQNEGRNSFEDMNRDDYVDNIQTAPSMQNEGRNSFEDGNQDDDVDNIQTAPSMQNGGRNSFEDRNRDDDVDKIEYVDSTVPKTQTKGISVVDPPETTTHQGKRKYNKRLKVGNKVKHNVGGNRNGSQNSASIRSKDMIDERNSFEDMNLVDNEDGFRNVENIQNEDSHGDVLDKTQPETASQQKRRKFFRFSKSDSRKKQDDHLKKASRNSNQKKKKIEEVEKLGEEVFDFVSEDDLEPHITITNASAENRKLPGVGDKRNSLRSRTRKTTKHLRASKDSEDQKASEYTQNSQHEDKKPEWPLCCLTTTQQTFSILKPVMRYDVPIDSLTLLGLGKKTKEKCKH